MNTYDTVKFRELLSDGTILLSRGRHQDALAKLEAAFQMDNTHYDVTLNLAGAYILTAVPDTTMPPCEGICTRI